LQNAKVQNQNHRRAKTMSDIFVGQVWRVHAAWFNKRKMVTHVLAENKPVEVEIVRDVGEDLFLVRRCDRPNEDDSARLYLTRSFLSDAAHCKLVRDDFAKEKL